MTSTHIGTWAMDKLIRFALLPRGGEPVVWDFGSAARHHQLYNPWLDHTPGPATPEGAGADRGPGRHLHAARRVPPGRRDRGRTWPARSPPCCASTGWPTSRSASTWPRCRCWPRCGAEGIETVDGQQVFLEARRIKTADEIIAAGPGVLDGRRRLRRSCTSSCGLGVRENECVGLVSKVLYDLGSEYVEGVNAISGRALLAAPARVLRPADPRPGTRRSSTSCTAHLGYRTCYYRTFAVGSASRAQRDAYVRCREYMDRRSHW